MSGIHSELKDCKVLILFWEESGNIDSLYTLFKDISSNLRATVGEYKATLPVLLILGLYLRTCKVH